MNENQNWENDVRAFMEAAGQTAPEEPSKISPQDAELRARLILEEAFETVRALGVDVLVRVGDSDSEDTLPLSFEDITLISVVPANILETVDGLCDVMYVTLGTFVTLGLPSGPFMDEVCKNNLTKVFPRVHIVNGKVQKPLDYQPPRLSEILSLEYMKVRDA